MPTYDYACRACDHIWTAEQKITEPALTTCPRCSKPEAQRLISGPGNFQLVGKGWAKDGYK
jgi:putative FmdB family regulatory protein